MTTKREPLVGDAALSLSGGVVIPQVIRDHYEAARAKDAELIQRLVDALEDARVALAWLEGMDEETAYAEIAIASAASAGFKPTEQP